MQQKNKGILIYGYNKTDAHFLQKTISDLLKDQIILESASNQEKKTVKEILDMHSGFCYEEDQPKIMLFFGMKDNSIQKILSHFPPTIKRPIFCGLTKHNINWEFKELIDHLLAEQEMMKKQLVNDETR